MSCVCERAVGRTKVIQDVTLMMSNNIVESLVLLTFGVAGGCDVGKIEKKVIVDVAPNELEIETAILAFSISR